MFKIIKILLIILFCPVILFGQDWNEIYYLDSDAKYFLQEKDFKKVILLYEKILDEIPESANVKYKLGKIYLEIDDQKDLAIDFLKEASRKASIGYDKKSLRELCAPLDVYLYLGIAYQIQGGLNQALEAYNKYKELINSGNPNYNLVDQKIKSCENAKLYMEKPIKLKFENLGDKINDQNSNFGAIVSGDEQTLIFTSYTSDYIDIYSSKKTNGQWSSPKKITGDVSKKYFIRTSSISYDGTELYLVTDDPENNDIFVSYLEGKIWTNAKKLSKRINGKKSNETHACVSKDGNILYFTSDRDGGMGGLDIYKSTKDSKGNWGAPENLGQSVNTEFDEETPFVSPDGKYLFFSSEGHNGIGGFDIFYIDLATKSQAINLGYPANTTDDDLFFVPAQSLNSGYVSRVEKDSRGQRDIYYQTELEKVRFAGNIKNIDGENISNIDFNVLISESEGNGVAQTLNSVNGQFNFEIYPGNYNVSINNENFENYTNKVIIPDDYSNAEYTFEVLLNPIQVKQEELVAEVIEEVVAAPIEDEFVRESVSQDVVDELPVKEAINNTSETISKSNNITYSVQLMALKNPVKVDYFKDINDVKMTENSDGYYRYTVGVLNSYKQAVALQKKIHSKGYKDAFIRTNNHTPNYTIQIMALKVPVNPDHFKGIPSVAITKGDDDYFRYTIGLFNTYDEAKQELSKLNSIGYNQAFIRVII